MSAETLREAAKVLRERSEIATPGPWRWVSYREDLPYLIGRGGDPATYAYDTEVIEANHSGECGCRSACHLGLEVAYSDRDYIATMHPRVGLKLADLLETLAFDREVNGEIDGRTWDHDIVPLARLILGQADQ